MECSQDKAEHFCSRIHDPHEGYSEGPVIKLEIAVYHADLQDMRPTYTAKYTELRSVT